MSHRTNRREFAALGVGALAFGTCGETDAPEAVGGGSLIGAKAVKPSQVGQEVLASGGNAIDAAITAALTAGVTELAACGIAGYGGHMVIALANGTVTAIDYNSTAPAAMRADTFAPDKNGNVPMAHNHGWLSAGVPGTIAGMQLALEKYGTRSFRDALAPGIAYARDGFEISEELAGRLVREAPKLRKDAGSVRLLFKDGKPLPQGTTFQNPELTAVLEELAAANSVEPFYRGEFGKQIAAQFEKNGGIVTADDMAAYRAHEVEPVQVDWRGYSIYTAPLTAGGATSLQAIGIMKALGWENYTDIQQQYHARLEALRIAWHDRFTLFGDPAHVEVPVAKLLSDEYAQEAAARVRGAVEKKQPLDVKTESRKQGGTIHISAADRAGNLVSLTLTHGESFGARTTVDGLGLILGHGMSRFDPWPGAANAPGPGKKPLHNMCPTVVLRDGRPIFAVGGRGGRRIPNSLFDVLMNFVGQDRPMQEAIDAPRMHTEGSLDVHCDAPWPEEDKVCLGGLGYNVIDARSAFMSAAHFDHATGETAAVWR